MVLFWPIVAAIVKQIAAEKVKGKVQEKAGSAGKSGKGSVAGLDLDLESIAKPTPLMDSAMPSPKGRGSTLGALSEIGKGVGDAVDTRLQDRGIVAQAGDTRPMLTRMSDAQFQRQLGTPAAPMSTLGALPAAAAMPEPVPSQSDAIGRSRVTPRPRRSTTLQHVVNPSFDMGYFRNGTFPWSDQEPVTIPYLPTDADGHTEVSMRVQPGEQVFVKPTSAVPTDALPKNEEGQFELPGGSKLRAGTAFLFGRADPSAWGASMTKSAGEKREEAFAKIYAETLKRAGGRELTFEEDNALNRYRDVLLGTDSASPPREADTRYQTFDEDRVGPGGRREFRNVTIRPGEVDPTYGPWVPRDAPQHGPVPTQKEIDSAWTKIAQRQDLERLGDKGLRAILDSIDPEGGLRGLNPDELVQAILMGADSNSVASMQFRDYWDAWNKTALDKDPEKWLQSREKFIERLHKIQGFRINEIDDGLGATGPSAADLELSAIAAGAERSPVPVQTRIQDPPFQEAPLMSLMPSTAEQASRITGRVADFWRSRDPEEMWRRRDEAMAGQRFKPDRRGVMQRLATSGR